MRVARPDPAISPGFAFVLCRCGCGKVATLIDDHYRRKTGYRRGHNPLTRGRGTCTFAECGRPHKAYGLCRMHYTRLRRHGDPNRGRKTIAERFWAKVDQTDDCWHWLGAVAGKYGRFQTSGRNSRIVQAHRFAYELLVGPIPDGLTIDHLCLNKLCVNPAHLEPVTGLENTRRHLRRVAAGAVPKDRQRNRKETDPSSALSP